MNFLKVFILAFVLTGSRALFAQDNCDYLRRVLAFEDDNFYVLMKVKNYPKQEVLFSLSVLKQFMEIEFGITYDDKVKMDSVLLSKCNEDLVFKDKKLVNYLKDYFKVDSLGLNNFSRSVHLKKIIGETMEKFQLFQRHQGNYDSLAFYSAARDIIIETDYLEIPIWFTERKLLISYFIRKGIVLREEHNRFLEVLDKSEFIQEF
ncbi:hypothetical protein SAMN05421640_1762 [Ekhidna lutea]|uniref:Uncharacterized protein n=1 Tax=Ekhidna lutea TaxID=447679 RepID=A0A239IPI2_EKHLU|nr:hypothetical protein [Ekhidna lutea]SNS95485.1 hypothetical protein SAMN05421640_1762 [Ekhidna lutea]